MAKYVGTPGLAFKAFRAQLAGTLRAVDWNDARIWLAIGLTGNALFFSRFVVQWVASERAGRSYVPVVFWWLSIAGSLVLLLYAIHRRDPVFVLAYLDRTSVV